MANCVVCKVKFVAQRNTAKYCGKRCTEFAQREAAKARKLGLSPLVSVKPATAAVLVASAEAIPLAEHLSLVDALSEKHRDVARIRRDAEADGRSYSAVASLLRLETELAREIADLRAKDAKPVQSGGSPEEILQDLLGAIGEMPDKYLDQIAQAIERRRPKLRLA